MSLAQSFALALAALYLAGTAPVSAQGRSDFGVPDIMVEEGGRSKKRPRPPAVTEDAKPVQQQQQKPVKRTTRRGSSYVPPATLPRTGAIVTPQAPSVYTPPPVNSFGDRVTRCNHSFPLNAGIGNNPTDRDSYVRQCAN